MSTEHMYTDEILTAWMDGELDSDQSDAIARAVENDPDLVARIEGLMIDTQSLRAAFDGMLAHAPEPVLPPARQETATASPSFFSGWRALAASVALLLAGSAGGYMAAEHKDDSWRGFVAAYQALYVPDTLTVLASDDAEKIDQLQAVSSVLGKELKLAALAETDRLDYKRAQVLGFRGRPLVQLAFLSEGGEPVALCIIRSEDIGVEPMTVRTMEDLASASWAKDGYEYLLIGGSDNADIETWAGQFISRL